MSSTTTPTDPDAESIQSGIAALNQTADPFSEPGPYDVSGLAMPENVVTRGGSGTTRMWPAETLRNAAEMLEGKSIVADFHPASPEQAPAGNIVGKITEAGYEDGVGLRFSGEVTDQEIAKKIDRNYLEVSTRPAIAEERYDADQDLYVVESIADFLDLGLVDMGAASGNSVGIGADPAVAALARSAIGYRGNYQYDALQDTTVSEPNWDGYSTSEWSAPSLEGTFNDDMDAARNSATFIRDGGESFGDLSLFVVDGERQLNVNGLDSAWLMASQTDDVSSDEVSRLRGMYESMAETARDAGEIGDETWEETWQPRIEGEGDGDTESNEANSNTAARQRFMTVPTAALQEDGDGGDTRLDVWSDFLADVSGSISVDEVNFDNLHRLLASEIPGADISDVAGALPADSFDEGFGAADARELISGLANQDGDSDDGGDGESGESESGGGDDGDEEETESNAAWNYQPESAVGALLMRDLELTGTTPNRCKTIKDGASTVDPEDDELARSILGLDDKDQTDLTRASAGDDPVAQQATGLSDPAEDGEEPDPTVKNRGDQDFSREDVVDGEDPIGRELFGMPDPAEETDEPDPTIKDVDRDLDYSGEGLVNADDPVDRELFGMPDPAEDDDEPDPTIKNKGPDGQDFAETVIGEDTDVVDREYVSSSGDDEDGEDD